MRFQAVLVGLATALLMPTPAASTSMTLTTPSIANFRENVSIPYQTVMAAWQQGHLPDSLTFGGLLSRLSSFEDMLKQMPLDTLTAAFKKRCAEMKATLVPIERPLASYEEASTNINVLRIRLDRHWETRDKTHAIWEAMMSARASILQSLEGITHGKADLLARFEPLQRDVLRLVRERVAPERWLALQKAKPDMCLDRECLSVGQHPRGEGEGQPIRINEDLDERSIEVLPYTFYGFIDLDCLTAKDMETVCAIEEAGKEAMALSMQKLKEHLGSVRGREREVVKASLATLIATKVHGLPKAERDAMVLKRRAAIAVLIQDLFRSAFPNEPVRRPALLSKIVIGSDRSLFIYKKAMQKAIETLSAHFNTAMKAGLMKQCIVHATEATLLLRILHKCEQDDGLKDVTVALKALHDSMHQRLERRNPMIRYSVKHLSPLQRSVLLHLLHELIERRTNLQLLWNALRLLGQEKARNLKASAKKMQKVIEDCSPEKPFFNVKDAEDAAELLEVLSKQAAIKSIGMEVATLSTKIGGMSLLMLERHKAQLQLAFQGLQAIVGPVFQSHLAQSCLKDTIELLRCVDDAMANRRAEQINDLEDEKLRLRIGALMEAKRVDIDAIRRMEKNVSQSGLKNKDKLLEALKTRREECTVSSKAPRQHVRKKMVVEEDAPAEKPAKKATQTVVEGIGRNGVAIYTQEDSEAYTSVASKPLQQTHAQLNSRKKISKPVDMTILSSKPIVECSLQKPPPNEIVCIAPIKNMEPVSQPILPAKPLHQPAAALHAAVTDPTISNHVSESDGAPDHFDQIDTFPTEINQDIRPGVVKLIPAILKGVPESRATVQTGRPTLPIAPAMLVKAKPTKQGRLNPKAAVFKPHIDEAMAILHVKEKLIIDLSNGAVFVFTVTHEMLRHLWALMSYDDPDLNRNVIRGVQFFSCALQAHPLRDQICIALPHAADAFALWHSLYAWDQSLAAIKCKFIWLLMAVDVPDKAWIDLLILAESLQTYRPGGDFYKYLKAFVALNNSRIHAFFADCARSMCQQCHSQGVLQSHQ